MPCLYVANGPNSIQAAQPSDGLAAWLFLNTQYSFLNTVSIFTVKYLTKEFFTC